MGVKGVYKYRIADKDLDFTRRPALVAIVDYILASAGEDADRRGFGLRTIAEHNWTWVLSRFSLEFDRYPHKNELLNITTWVSEVGRLMTTRNFIITSVDGERIGAAVSNWAMLDMTQRKAIDLTGNLEYANAIINDPSPINAPPKLRAITPHSQTSHKVAYSDIDFNRHTNSMRYLEMMMDMMPLEYLESHTVRRMDLCFNHESRYGDTLCIALQHQHTDMFEIQNQDQKIICRASIEWQEANRSGL